MKRIAITTTTMFLGLAAFAIGASQEWVLKQLKNTYPTTTISNGATIIRSSNFRTVSWPSTHYALCITNASASSVAANITNGTLLAYCATNHSYVGKYAVVVAETNALYYLGSPNTFTNGVVGFAGAFDVLRAKISEPMAEKILKEAN